MGKYLVPLWVFVGGHMVMLFLFLFLNTIGTAADQLAADTAEMAPAFWNWTWVASGNTVKFLVLILLELLVLFATAKAFLKVR